MRGTRALAAAATGTLGPLCAAAWLVAFLRGERCLAHCRARERCLGSLVWETASVVWALERTKEQEPAQTNPEIMRTAVFLSLIAAARAFAPPSILRATVVVKNEADAASTVPESHRRIPVARGAVMPRALCRASTLLLNTKRFAGGAQ